MTQNDVGLETVIGDDEYEEVVASINIIQLKGVARKLKTALCTKNNLGPNRRLSKNPYQSLGQNDHRVKCRSIL